MHNIKQVGKKIGDPIHESPIFNEIQQNAGIDILLNFLLHNAVVRQLKQPIILHSCTGRRGSSNHNDPVIFRQLEFRERFRSGSAVIFCPRSNAVIIDLHQHPLLSVARYRAVS